MPALLASMIKTRPVDNAPPRLIGEDFGVVAEGVKDINNLTSEEMSQ